MRDHICDILFAALYLVLAAVFVTSIIITMGYIGPNVIAGNIIGIFFAILASLIGIMGGVLALTMMLSHLVDIRKP